MTEDFNPNVSFEELENIPDAPQSGGPVSLKTGIGGNVEADPDNKDPDLRPNAVRWIFNPYEIVDLTNKGASCGMSFLQNVIFNKVKSIKINVPITSTTDLPRGPMDPHNPESYTKYDRTSYMIARELEELAGDKGVATIDEITGFEDSDAEAINVSLFGESIHCVEDANNPEHPCPVLPVLAEQLDANLRNYQDSSETSRIITAAGAKVRQSIADAMKNARLRIDLAQKRMLEENNPNKTLSVAEQRCYLALGEEVPNQMPFLTKSARAGVNQPIDSEALGRGIAAGFAQAGVGQTSKPNVPVEVKNKKKAE